MILFFDTETTGLYPGRIIQLSYVMCDGENTTAKNFFFVPFGQDEPIKKPKSLVADWAKLEDTLNFALRGEQIQPVLF